MTIEQLRWEWIRFENLLRATGAGLDGNPPASADPRVSDALDAWRGKVDGWRHEVEEMLRCYPLPAAPERQTETAVRAVSAQR